MTFENMRYESYDTSNLPHLKCEACEMYVENLVYVKELVRLISCPNHLRVQVKTSLSLCGKNDIADRR